MTKAHPRFARHIGIGMLLLVLLPAVPAHGQDARETAILELAKRVPTAADDQIIKDWLNWEIDRMLRQPNPSEFLNNLKRIYDTSTVEVFKTQFLKVASSVFAAEFSKADGMTGPKAAVLVQGLAQFPRVEVFEGLSAALQHPESEVRYLAARTFASLQSIVSEDQFGRQRMIDGIVAAATKETNGVVLRAMYQAVQFNNQPVESLAALTKIIKAQAGVSRSVPAADGAESTAFRFIKSNMSRLNPVDKTDLVKAVAAMLNCRTLRYLNATLTPEWRTSHLYGMLACEEMLKDLLGPGAQDVGNIKKALAESGPEGRKINVELQRLNWVGTAQNSSALNKAPYNMPVDFQGVPCP